MIGDGRPIQSAAKLLRLVGQLVMGRTKSTPIPRRALKNRQGPAALENSVGTQRVWRFEIGALALEQFVQRYRGFAFAALGSHGVPMRFREEMFN
jgi:hypothetical protein